jgi:hypothetical protein
MLMLPTCFLTLKKRRKEKKEKTEKTRNWTETRRGKN